MGSNLRRRGTIFWFRRRVPDTLAGRLGGLEIQRSLRTSSPRVAASRARQAWLVTEEVFARMARNPTLAAAQARLLIDQLLQESVFDSPTADELVAAMGSGEIGVARQLFSEVGVDQIMALSEEDRAKIGVHMSRIADRALVDGARRGEAWQREKADLATAMADHAHARATEAETQLAKNEVARQVAERLRELVGALPGTVAQVQEVAEDAKPTKARKASKSPPFSKVEQAFLQDRTRGQDGYSGQTASQVGSTFRLWLDLVGDKPVGDYTGADAGRFRDLVLRMPASHGKGGRVNAVDAIRVADRREAETGQPVPRLSMKTAKRHFSALSQLWVWLQPREHVERNIFRGFTFPGTKSNRRLRSDWADQDLVALLGSPWFGAAAPTDSARRWLPIIAMFSGLRLEEAARLRAVEDVGDVDGVPAFRIQSHPDGWSPKSEAGERTVPIHPALIELGLLDVVQRRRAGGQASLWPELEASGPDGKLSTGFGRKFGKAKDGLGIGKATTFHSYRHNVSTILRNTATPETWIDAILGHEGEQRSVGASVYLKRIGIQNLKATVGAISYSEPVMAAVRGAFGLKP